MEEPFGMEISRRIWDTKYRFREGESIRDGSITDTWRRVARALAAVEGAPGQWEGPFYELLEGFRFLPGGRILAGAGTGRQVTLFNCFVMGSVGDSMDGIFDALKEGALTMQQGGGVGYDFSTLRPAGSVAGHTAALASGPVSFMDVWDAMCATVLSTGARRGAMMATLRCDHPDIEQFIEAKRRPGRLRHFNLSVQVTDEFMRAVRADADWSLVFPAAAVGSGGETVLREWPGYDGSVPCRVVRRVRARGLWDRIMVSTYDYAEPGVLFVDRINELNNLRYRERISATNPCGEVPLPPYGACDLGSINVARFIGEPFTARAALDLPRLRVAVATAVRMMDDVIDASLYPLAAQAQQAHGTRRIGLGLTGLADALVMLGLRYDSEAGRVQAAEMMREICLGAYAASVAVSREKGPFPFFDAACYLESPFIRALPGPLRDEIAAHGIRNSHLTAIAPTGTVSLLADNVSSGLEPIFDVSYQRRVLERNGDYREFEVQDNAFARWRGLKGDLPLPEAFVTAHQIAPEDHLAMQAALQPWVDNSISKTVNVPGDFPFERFRDLYVWAYDHGLKGCTTFRPNPVTGEVLTSRVRVEPGSPCCGIEREAD